MPPEATRNKILIVDDDEEDFYITSEYILSIPGDANHVEWAKSYKQGIAKLATKEFDLCFVDYLLGAKSGVDFLKDAAHARFETPIILLTGNGNYKIDLESMQLGAVDYLVKTELNAEKLERCIRYALDRTTSLKALQASEKKYRNIFENSKDIIFTANDELIITDINEAVQQCLGFTRTEIRGISLYQLVLPQNLPILNAYAGRRTGNAEELELVLTTRDGEKRHCMLTLTTADGYRQGIIHDITNLKKIEKSNMMAEKLAATGRLVRTLAHEVRNPLNNITLAAEQMAHHTDDGQQPLYTDIILRNSRRISNLITELLHTSHPAENVLRQELLQTIIEDVLTSCSDRLTLKRILLQTSTANGPIHIMADAEKLKLALLNVVINAIEAVNHEDGRLYVSLQSIGELAVLTISDNGCGISSENMTRLFEPYFTSKRNGLGLGLTFTLNILQAHKATIDVSSTVGKGTTFMISFPIPRQTNP